jgi:ABC-type multidrug transport system ATPase subunit
MQVRSLSFGYSGRWLFTDFSLELARGLTWLRGVNGCNKCSLLRLLAGVLQPVTGTLFAAGDDAAQDPLGYRCQIFWCRPDGIAFNHLRGDEFLRFLVGLYPHWYGAQRAKKLSDATAL